jgi:hypothetical protein
MTKPQLRDVSPKAVILGATVDIVATNVAMLPVATFVLIRLAQGAGAATPAQQQAALTAAFTENPTLYLTGMVLGCAASVLGGWVAARVALRAEVLNGALSALACMAFGVYGLIAHPGMASPLEHAAFFVLSPSLGALGGAIRKRRHERVDASARMDEPEAIVQATPRLAGLRLAVFCLNRVLLAISVLGLLMFGLTGLYGYTQHQGAMILGSVVVCAIGLIAIVLLFVAGRMLRAGRRTHWLLHGSALALMAIPVALMIYGLSKARSAAGPNAASVSEAPL